MNKARLRRREPRRKTRGFRRIRLRFVRSVALDETETLEVRNSLRPKVFRGEMTRSELRRTLSRLAEDVREGRWHLPRYTVSDVYRKAEELSGKHAASTGCRSLDILHVAGAIIFGVRDFLTFDAGEARPEGSTGGCFLHRRRADDAGEYFRCHRHPARWHRDAVLRDGNVGDGFGRGCAASDSTRSG
jgi:hypothetical protein